MHAMYGPDVQRLATGAEFEGYTFYFINCIFCACAIGSNQDRCMAYIVKLHFVHSACPNRFIIYLHSDIGLSYYFIHRYTRMHTHIILQATHLLLLTTCTGCCFNNTMFEVYIHVQTILNRQ